MVNSPIFPSQPEGLTSMDVLEAIHQRRSIRSFTSQPVPDDVLAQILEAGTWAPSAGNMQAWEFVIVKDPDARRKLVDTTDAGNTARGGIYTQEWIMQSPAIVVICYDVKRMTGRYGHKGSSLMTIMDCMLCVENMALAATHFCLGTCCVVGFDPLKLKELLPIPKEITPLLLLPMGYPAQTPSPPYRLPLEDVVRLVI
jgi:nitroreductase